jgi:hypothetical protein
MGVTHLNLGCNVNLLPRPFLNVDILDLPVELILDGKPWEENFDFRLGDIGNLSWIGAEEVEEVRAEFVLEHLHLDDIPDTLYEWSRVLKIGGKIKACVPDAEYQAKAILNWIRRRDLNSWMKFRVANFELLNPVDSGPLAVGPGAAHKSLWTKASAELLFEAQGFKVETYFETEPLQGIQTLVIIGTKTYSINRRDRFTKSPDREGATSEVESRLRTESP